MKKRLLLLLFTVLHLLYAYAYSRNTSMHYFTITAYGGYSRFFTNMKDVTIKGRPGAGFGLGYEYRTKGLWVQTGLEGQLLMNSSLFAIKPDAFEYEVYDTQGKSLTMLYSVSKFSEIEQLVNLYVPIMIGYFNSSGFYVGGGLKLGGVIYSNTDAHLDYRTVGMYNRYIDKMENMLNHFYTDYSINHKAHTTARFKSSLFFEIGGDVLASSAYSHGIQSNSCRSLKIAAFAEMGLNSPYPKTTEESALVYPNKDQAQILESECLYNIKMSNSYSFIPFCAGIKLTLMFRFSTPRSRCNCSSH